MKLRFSIYMKNHSSCVSTSLYLNRVAVCVAELFQVLRVFEVEVKLFFCLGNCRCRPGGVFCTIKAQTGMKLYWLCHQYQKNLVKSGSLI